MELTGIGIPSQNCVQLLLALVDLVWPLFAGFSLRITVAGLVGCQICYCGAFMENIAAARVRFLELEVRVALTEAGARGERERGIE